MGFEVLRRAIRRPSRSTGVFAALSTVAIALLLFEGENQWFFNDDWGHWSINRSGPAITGKLDYFFAPHNGHWMTFNRVVFEGIYRLTGLRWYLAYLVPVLVLHTCAAWLLRYLIRRAGTSSAVATAAGAVFLLLGTGAEVLLWADAAGFMAGLVFGGIQLVLADHDDKKVTGRDYLGILIGLVSVTTGAAAITMLGVVGLSGMLRRRYRHAILHVAVPATAWALWYLAIGHRDQQPTIDRAHLPQAPSYWFSGITTSIEAVTMVGAASIILVAVAWFVISRCRRWQETRQAPILATALALPAFWLQIVIARIQEEVPPGASSRYLYLSAFFVLPVLAVAADDLARGRQAIRTIAAAIFSWAAISNAAALDSYGQFAGGRAWHIKLGVSTALSLPGVDALPDDTLLEDPDGIVKPGWVAPIGVLRQLHDHGDFGSSLLDTNERERLRWGAPLLVQLTTVGPAEPCPRRLVDSETFAGAPPSPLKVITATSASTVVVRLRSRHDDAISVERTLTAPANATSSLIVDLDDVSVSVSSTGGASICLP